MLAHFKYPAYYQLCTVEATIDTEASAEAHFAKELECVKVWEHQHQLVQLCSYECESFCSHTRCAADNSLFFVPFVSVPDKSPCKVGVWFTKFMVCFWLHS